MTSPLPPEGAPVHGTGPLLDIQGLQTYFRTSEGVVKAVDGLDLALQRGQTLGVVGESGCGKSVTALSILRLIAPPGWIAGGHIYFQGRDLLTLAAEQMRQVRDEDIAVIFQVPPAAREPVDRVGEQVGEATTGHHTARPRAALGRTRALFDHLGLPPPEQLARGLPPTLSAGMRRRMMVARALARQPALLIADEPTTGLAGPRQAQVLALHRDLQVTVQTATLLITHDLGVVAQMADEVAVLHAGKVVEQGLVGAVLTQPKHPYTVGLLQSPPEPGHAHLRLRVLPGPVPDRVNRPAGCPFAPRCPQVMALCREQEPPLKEVAGGSLTRCWLY